MTELTREIVRELLHYDPSTGVFTWKARGREWFRGERECKSWNNRYAGARAGTVRKYPTGYQKCEVKLLGKDHRAHRLAWLYMTDEPMPEQLDHRDRDATNNAWSNIRASSSMENNRNLSMRKDNSSGVTGVTWNKAAGKWRVTCMLDGKRRHLGYFDGIDEAARVAREFRAAHGFDPMHGMEAAHYHGVSA